MRAIVVDPEVNGGLRVGEARDPEAGPDRALVEIRHLSLNFGDLSSARNQPAGFVPGWDAAGVVLEPAGNGGPPVGARVVTTDGAQGGWAERRAAPLEDLAVVPDDVGLDVASTLPIAGISALRALQRCGALLGRRVLVTGASGGVGRFAVQLAALGGATVIASVGSPARGEGLEALGASQVAVGLDGVSAPLDVVVDNVGGHQLAAIFGLLGEGGVIQSVGWTAGEELVFPPYATVGMTRSLTSFSKGPRSGPDLEYLLALVRTGSLTVDIGWRGPWERITEAAEALLGRRVGGKAVLDVT